jgi:hypothetical protein
MMLPTSDMLLLLPLLVPCCYRPSGMPYTKLVSRRTL